MFLSSAASQHTLHGTARKSINQIPVSYDWRRYINYRSYWRTSVKMDHALVSVSPSVSVNNRRRTEPQKETIQPTAKPRDSVYIPQRITVEAERNNPLYQSKMFNNEQWCRLKSNLIRPAENACVQIPRLGQNQWISAIKVAFSMTGSPFP